MIPVTGGIFTVTMTHPIRQISGSSNPDSGLVPTITNTLIWDRKAEGGFPETKELKNRVRNIIEPERDLGHIDRSLEKSKRQGQDVENKTDGDERPDKAGEGLKSDVVVGEKQKEPQVCEDCI